MSNQQEALKIVQKLHENGYQALFAGGCVRDQLLKRPAHDYDVATNATPDEVIKLFPKTLKVGAHFGVIIVLIKGVQVEVATFRTEGGYQDGRHPENIRFTNAKEDASRRDFTVNGMFYDPIADEILDFVEGQPDIEKRLLRTIGNPDERFSEDYLRMLRAVRFAVKLDFTIDDTTWRSVCSHADKITHISAERIACELEGILTHPNRKFGLELLLQSGLIQAFFTEFKGQVADFGTQTIANLCEDIDLPLALAAVWAGADNQTALQQCEYLKLSNAQMKHLRYLLENRNVLLNAELPLAELKMLMHQPYFMDLCDLQIAIEKAKNEPINAIIDNKNRALAIDKDNIKPAPLLNGNELMALGVEPGPSVGHASRELYIAQLSEHLHTPDQAKKWLADWLKKHQKSD